MTPRLFRQLIVAWWALGIVCVLVILVTERYLPAELLHYIDSVANTDPTAFEWIIIALGFVLLLLLIAASIAAFRFKRWGRSLFLWINVVSLGFSPVFGESILSAYAATICYLYAVLTGGILFTMYLPPIGPFFESNDTGHEGWQSSLKR